MVVPIISVLMVSGLHVPVKPSADFFGNAGGLEFWQRRPIGVKVGTICDVISMSIVATVPHWPPFGVNVYVVFPIKAVLIVAGLHVPVMPSMEVVGNAVAADPWQNGPIGAKLTAMSGLIVTLMVAVVAHCPAFGVNVYVVVPTLDVLIVAGLHVPETPSVDFAGRGGVTLF